MTQKDKDTSAPPKKSAAELKAERERAARIAAFTQANHRPPNTDVDAILARAGGGESETPGAATADPVQASVEPVAAAQDAAAPAVEETAPQAPEPTATVPTPSPTPRKPSAPRKSAPATAGKPQPKPATVPAAPEPVPGPWDEGDDKAVGFTTKFEAKLYRQMQWMTENVPREKSIQRVVHNAVAEYVARKIAEHYEP